MTQDDRIRVLVVDDTAFMRSAIKGMINACPDMNVVGTAKDGIDALHKIQELQPDIVTLDLQMPHMDGLTTLEHIMKDHPLPVLVVSSASQSSIQATFDALDHGAVDFICKDKRARSMNIVNIEDVLIMKIRNIVSKKASSATVIQKELSALHPHQVLPPVSQHRLSEDMMNVIAIGASTGGPKALLDVIPYLPKDFPAAVLIVQHMPEHFTKSFADRLNSISYVHVKEAEPGDIITGGTVYVARGGSHLKIVRLTPHKVKIEFSKLPDNILYRPSVDVMMQSAVEVYGDRCFGVIMTGMGNDGTEGMRAIKQCGGRTLAQDEESCIVYGMPRSVIENGLADRVVPLSKIAHEIVDML